MSLGLTEAEERPRGSAEFAESSILEAIVPVNSSVDFEAELNAWDGSVEEENNSILPFISQRQFVLFDELVPVYVVLRTPYIEEATLKSFLSRLAINVESFAISTAPLPETGETNAQHLKELIYSETIKDSYEPFVFSSNNDPGSHTYIVWKVKLFISRPRARLSKPAVYFTPAASLKPAERAKKKVIEDEYLPSRVPAALNLLQPFENDPALAGAHPRLSALRISKIAPTAPVAKELTRPIRIGLRRLFRVAPAVIWRVRYSRWPTSLNEVAIVASLDLEIAPVTNCKVKVEEIELTLHGGSAQPYLDIAGNNKSMTCNPGDQITLLYKLVPTSEAENPAASDAPVRILDLKVSAKVLVSPDCQPEILIEWGTNVDFSLGLSTGYGNASRLLGHPLNQLTIPPPQPPKASAPDSLSQHDESSPQDSAGPSDIQISLTISGPPKVQVGEVFHWNLFIVNRSQRNRKLAVVVISKRRRDLDKHRSQTSTSSAGGREQDREDLLAAAVLDDNIVYAKQKNAKQEPAELVSLTTDVRIGHIGPGACYTAELRFLALVKGVLSVDALRVLDLSTQDAVDIRDLPTVVAVD